MDLAGYQMTRRKGGRSVHFMGKQGFAPMGSDERRVTRNLTVVVSAPTERDLDSVEDKIEEFLYQQGITVEDWF